MLHHLDNAIFLFNQMYMTRLMYAQTRVQRIAMAPVYAES